MRNVLIILILLAFSIEARTQIPSRNRKEVYIVWLTKEGKPLKIYSNTEECLHFMDVNKPYSNQTIMLYFPEDTVRWRPEDKMLIDDLTDPQPLTDKYLKQRTVYLVIQKHFHTLGDCAFTNKEDCIKYATKWEENYVEIPYFYRDEDSYKEIYKRREARDKKRKWYRSE